MIHFKALLADTPLPDPTTLSSPINGQPDPLIDQGGQLTIYIGASLIIIGIVAIVGFFSRRVEHALLTALVLSLGLVAFWAFTR
ncbi:hypothetical protein [Pantanalinema sp. GBBB05]|uniref:hypothetical protein n=1 Tax=Pantanalinema sp. GBBB05 TaxID=2604139 RepID=UPI001D61E8F6|nr:hypothetical protein [Pantanalinema sp. GBBB05]